MTARKPKSERVQTDESLRNERKNADDAMSESHSAEHVADLLVSRARVRADAVVEEADQRGLGLGVYIAKCIVTGHHGRIWFENATAGGATLHCALPRAAPVATA